MRHAWIILALVVPSGSVGCGGYAIEGSVIEGSFSDAQIVAADDPALDGPGVQGAQVRIVRDPNGIRPTTVAEARSSSDGEFLLEIGEFGAGWMEEQWLIRAEKTGFRSVQTLVRLPSNSSERRLLITLEPGADGPTRGAENLMEEFERHR
jgi:hypothetical protein